MPNLPTTPRSATNMVRKVLHGVDGISAVRTTWQTDALGTIVFLTPDVDGKAVLAYLAAAFVDVKVSGHLGYDFIGIAFPLPNSTAGR